MFTLDANIFVRAVDIRDHDHATCHALLDAMRLQHTPLICPHILLPEVAGAVRRTWQDAVRGRLAAQFVSELPILTLVVVDAVLANLPDERGLVERSEGFELLARRLDAELGA